MTAALDAVNALIQRREHSLALALRARITLTLRDFEPTAVSLRTYRSDRRQGHVVDRIIGPHNRVLWDVESEGDARPLPTGLNDDVLTYVSLRPRAMRLAKTRELSYIVTLTRPAKARP